MCSLYIIVIGPIYVIVNLGIVDGLTSGFSKHVFFFLQRFIMHYRMKFYGYENGRCYVNDDAYNEEIISLCYVGCEFQKLIQIVRLYLEYIIFLAFIYLNLLIKYDILMSVLLIQLISCTIMYLLYPNIVNVP